MFANTYSYGCYFHNPGRSSGCRNHLLLRRKIDHDDAGRNPRKTGSSVTCAAGSHFLVPPVRMRVAGTILPYRPDCSFARWSRMTARWRDARHIASSAIDARSVAAHVESIDRDFASPENESRASAAKPDEGNGMRPSGSVRRGWGDHDCRKSRRIHGSTPSHPDHR